MQSVSVVGTWKLISAKAQNPNDHVIHLYGGDPLGGTSEEIKEAFEGFDAYCGTYEVNAEKRTVTHHVKASRFPNCEGTDQLRYFEFSGTRLILKTAPIPAIGTE